MATRESSRQPQRDIQITKLMVSILDLKVKKIVDRKVCSYLDSEVRVSLGKRPVM